MHVVVTNAAQDDFFGNRSRNLISCECVYNVDHGNELSNSLPLPQSKVERLFCEYSGLFSMMFVKVKKMLILTHAKKKFGVKARRLQFLVQPGFQTFCFHFRGLFNK